jgi:hypothetical protein
LKIARDNLEAVYRIRMKRNGKKKTKTNNDTQITTQKENPKD